MSQPVHPTRPSIAAGVCIVRQGQEKNLDINLLQKQGLKLRPSASCVPDLILTVPALLAPLAVMVAMAGSADDSLGSIAFMDRCSNMASTFRCCCLLIPYSLASHAAVLQVACGPRYKGKVQLHYYSPTDCLTDCILQLLQDQLTSSSSLQELAACTQDERIASATSQEALQLCLRSVASSSQALPAAADMQAMVGVFGSLQELSHASAEDIMACAVCTVEQARHLLWLWNAVPD